MPPLTRLDVNSLRKLAPMDALLYGFAFDSGLGVLRLSIGIDPVYHKDAAEELQLHGADERVIDLVLEGIRTISLKHAVAVQEGMAPDEPPHEYEIAVWQVKQGAAGRAASLVIRCYSGPHLTVEFHGARAEDSTRAVGTRHDYAARLGPGVTIRTGDD